MRWLAIVVFSILPVVAQVKEDPSYEGQPVASVELGSDPRTDLEAYRSKVQQTAGQPFSWEKVRANVSALQEIGGNNTNPSARVAIQQRVTKSFQFTFSTDLTSAQNEVVQGEYQLNKRWSMSVTRDESGGFAVDGKFHTNF
jgi:hypothetical protein